MSYTVEEIREKITTDDRWAVRAALALLQAQTSDEQRETRTKHKNQVGFNSPDGHKLTSMAKVARSGLPLSPKQLAYIKARIGKYAPQLWKLNQGKVPSAQISTEASQLGMHKFPIQFFFNDTKVTLLQMFKDNEGDLTHAVYTGIGIRLTIFND